MSTSSGCRRTSSRSVTTSARGSAGTSARPELANRTEPVEVAPAFAERIAHDNALDVELYEFARDARRRPAPRARCTGPMTLRRLSAAISRSAAGQYTSGIWSSGYADGAKNHVSIA
ncbi:MAG: hypothetical protein KatS3mg010_0563 [Acidimicrobiia bacterium]|nr:MAG: hypothetical protein KatS3mg010_0563 [Acidimicrobiia bacterium]